MKLWLISQDVNSDYDTYDSAVVVAASEADARVINPTPEYHIWKDGKWHYSYGAQEVLMRGADSSWTHPDNVAVKLLGDAVGALNAGEVVLASYNAG